MKRVCVFCGSNRGVKPEYLQAAEQTGQALVSRGLGLVYGGTSVGLMRAVADTVLDAGGEVIGVIPEALVGKEHAYARLDDLRIVGSMQARKAMMAELSDAFIALPGGLGTLDEIFEMLTWSQLGIHRKPCGLLDIEGYYGDLIAFLDHATSQQFIKPNHRAMILIDKDPSRLLARFVEYQAPTTGKQTDGAPAI